MHVIKRPQGQPRECGGFSVVLAEKVLNVAHSVGLPKQWAQLPLGHVSERRTSYRPDERITAVLAGLACGLKGIAPGNTVLRTNTAVQRKTGGRFPDQGTIHRWLQQVTPEQAAAFRSHLHQVLKQNGRFRSAVQSGRRIVVDVDAQGLVARGQRFERAAFGHLGEGIDRGYQRYVAYVGETREVLDEFLRPGNTMVLEQLTEVLSGLNEIFEPEVRSGVVIRSDAHGGTVKNLLALQASGYSYVCPMMSHWGGDRLKKAVCSVVPPTGRFTPQKSSRDRRLIEFWDVENWVFKGRRRADGEVESRAIAFRETVQGRDNFWTVLLTDMKDLSPQELWTLYHQRGGTIEEYNDQSERAFHLEVMRTGCYEGLNVLHALLALCWNLSVWALEDLGLPPVSAPHADRARWIPALSLDRSHLLQRAALSGLRLYRPPDSSHLEVEDTAATPESNAWLRWLCQPIQPRLRLAV